MRIKSFAVAAAVLMVAGLAAIAVAVHLLDPTSLAASLAASVKADTGRELAFGAVEVTLLPRPSFVLSELRFANAAWGSRPWLVQAGRASADIDVLALFSRRLRITRIELTDASLFLETDPKGNGNWSIGPAGAATPAWLDSLQINELALESLALAYRDGATGKTTAAQIDAARIDASGEARSMHLSARAKFAGKQVEAGGTIGALRALLADSPAFPVDLEGKVGAAGISLRGTIDKPRTLERLKLALSVRTVELGEFAPLWGASARPLGPLNGAAQLTGSAAAPAFTDIDVTLGGREKPEIRLRGAVSNLREASGIDLKLAASATKAWYFGKAAAGPLLPPFRASARVRDAQQGYRLDELELRITDGAGKESPQLVQGGQLAIKGGKLEVNALQATLGGAKLTLAGSIAEPRNFAGVDLGVALQGDELAELYKHFGLTVLPWGPYRWRARMQGSLDALRLTDIDVHAGRPGQLLRITGQLEDVVARRGIRLAIAANISDSKAAGTLLGIELPQLPAIRFTARIAEAPDGYAFEDLKFAMGRTSVQGRMTHARAEPRQRITADLSGPLVDLSELPRSQSKSGATNPLLAADVDANIRFDRVVLPDRRALGPVSGEARLAAGVLEFKQFSVAVDGASATLDGRIGDPLAPAGIDLMLATKVTTGAGLAAFTGIGLQNLPAFAASARLTDVPNGYALTGLKLAHAATTLAGEVTVTRGAERFKVIAKANSPLLDLSAPTPPAVASSPAKSKSVGTRVIPNAPLPLDLLRAIDAELDLRFDAVKSGEAPPLGPLVARAAIAEGSLKAEPVQLFVKADQAFSASVAVDAAKSTATLRILGKGIDAGELLARLGRGGEITGGSIDLEIQLQGRGKSLGEVLGTLDGNLRLSVGPHRVNNFALNLGRGLFTSIFALANPFQKTDPYTDVKCFAASMPVKNGVLTSERNIAIETAKYNVIATGTLDLRTERIDLVVTPVVRGEAGTMVRVGGTLADPSAGIDVAGAARSAASLGAAVVMPAWLVADSVLKKAAADPAPCATALAR